MIQKILFLLLFPLVLFAREYEQLPEVYRVKIGSSRAPSIIVEYFSLSCPLCLKLIRQEFKDIFEKQIQKERVSWEFHPDPQDITTLQLMVCLEALPSSKRWPFFWEIVMATKPASVGMTSFLMEELMKKYERSLPLLHDIKFLETTRAYTEAFKYLNQKEIPEELPAIELNGKRVEGLPTVKRITHLLIQEGGEK